MRWIEVSFKDTYFLRKLKILQPKHDPFMMKNITIAFSNGFKFDYMLPNVKTWIDIDIPNGAHSHFVNITGNSNYGADYYGMSEIQAFGCHPGILLFCM